MLSPIIPRSRRITEVRRAENALCLESEDGVLRLMPKDENIIRVSYVRKETEGVTPEFPNNDTTSGANKKEWFADKDTTPGVINNDRFADWEYTLLPEDSDEDESLMLITPALSVSVDLASGALTYSDKNGRVLLRENASSARELNRFPVFKTVDSENVETEKIKTADGEKSVIKSIKKVEDGFLYHSRLHLVFDDDEALYGLGQHEEGVMNLRGKTVLGHQANRKIAIPMLVSTKGWGILFDTYSPFIFNDTEIGTYFYQEAVKIMDYYFISGQRCSGAEKSEAKDSGLKKQETEDLWHNSDFFGPETIHPMDAVIAGYRKLTGPAVILPKWAYGYIQSQERYETEEEILAVAEEYKKRGLGLSCLVLDWMSWEDNMWGQKSFDKKRFPDVPGMIKKLHEKDVHFMLSIWPNMSENTSDYKAFKEQNGLLTGTGIYNAFDENNRKLYWEQVEKNLFEKGVDAWWCDSSEPITPEWNGIDRPEPAKLYETYVRDLSNHMPVELSNAFCLFHAQTLSEGMRSYFGVCGKENDDSKQDVSKLMEQQTKELSRYLSDIPEKRVCNLTRSGYTGGQRYGTILWSGDISASWKTLKQQIAAGVNFCASGLPYWTVDIGAFFVKRGIQWYWDGDYAAGTDDLGYRELFVRWYEWGCFLPIFRGHGTDVRRELWQFEDEVQNDGLRQREALQKNDELSESDAPQKNGELPKNAFYNALKKYNLLRYELLPYFYSLAGFAFLEGKSIMRPLAFEFPEDKKVYDIKDQYMIGSELMICPVTEPMYFGPGSKKPAGKTRKVYFPEGEGFYDFYTGAFYEGGQTVEVDAPLDVIPVFVKEGSIIPMGNPCTSSAEAGKEIIPRVFSKKNTTALFYTDAGDGYGYEKGEYSINRYTYDAEMRIVW